METAFAIEHRIKMDLIKDGKLEGVIILMRAFSYLLLKHFHFELRKKFVTIL